MNGVSGIYHSTVDAIHWGSDTIAKLTDKVVTTRNSLASLISGLIFFEKLGPFIQQLPNHIQNYVPAAVTQTLESLAPYAETLKSAIPTLAKYRFRLEIAKDFMTLVALFEPIVELTTKEFWEKSGVAKIANRICKVVYGTIETFLIIPNKWNWIDLGAICNSIGNSWITYTNLVIFKDLWVLGASSFGLYVASQDWKEAHSKIGAYANRIGAISQILAAPVDATPAGRDALLQTYENGKDKTASALKAYQQFLRWDAEVERLTGEVAALTVAPGNAAQIERKTQELELAKSNRLKQKEKIQRLGCFSARAFGVNPLTTAKDRITLTEFDKQRRALLAALPNGVIKTYIQGQPVDTPVQQNALLTSLRTIVTTLNVAYFNPATQADGSWAMLKNALEFADKLDQATPIAPTDAQLRKVAEYKIAKSSVKTVLLESKERKSLITGIFEVTKIAIVTLGILASLATLIAAFANFSFIIGSISLFTGLSVGIVGAVKTINDTFFNKEPRDVLLPTTNLAV
jgi:hypothetical protein